MIVDNQKLSMTGTSNDCLLTVNRVLTVIKPHRHLNVNKTINECLHNIREKTPEGRLRCHSCRYVGRYSIEYLY